MLNAKKFQYAIKRNCFILHAKNRGVLAYFTETRQKLEYFII